MNILKKGFTIVELTVVVAILAILATISMISLQSQNINARNSVRATDLSNIRKTLDSYFTTTSNYPETTNPGKVTYSGSELITIWEQGTFGETTRKITNDLSNIPLDPLTKTEYVYSVSNDKQEYQIAGIVEGASDVAYAIVNKTHANGGNDVKLKIAGNYNGKVLKYKDAKKLYVFAIPSLIHSKIGNVDITDIIDNKDLLYTGDSKIPEIYKSANIDTNSQGEILVKSDKILVFSGAENDLFKGDFQDDFIDKLKSAYIGTSLTTENRINKITTTHSGNKRYVAQVVIKKDILPNLEITAENAKELKCGEDHKKIVITTPANACENGEVSGMYDYSEGASYQWACKRGDELVGCYSYHKCVNGYDFEDNKTIDSSKFCMKVDGLGKTDGYGFEYRSGNAYVVHNGIETTYFGFERNTRISTYRDNSGAYLLYMKSGHKMYIDKIDDCGDSCGGTHYGSFINGFNYAPFFLINGDWYKNCGSYIPNGPKYIDLSSCTKINDGDTLWLGGKNFNASLGYNRITLTESSSCSAYISEFECNDNPPCWWDYPTSSCLE